MGGSLASSGQGAFLKSSYPSPDAVAGGDSVSRGTPSPDDNNSGRVQGGNGTVASSSLHSSQLSTFNEKGGLLAPHPNPAGNGRYSANNTIDGRGKFFSSSYSSIIKFYDKVIYVVENLPVKRELHRTIFNP